jgi:hypothetical protein
VGKLTKVEISFLRWLYNQGGRCALSENDDLSTYYRLVKAGYVEVQLPDRFNPAVVNFKLTESGQWALEAAAGHETRPRDPHAPISHQQTSGNSFHEGLSFESVESARRRRKWRVLSSTGKETINLRNDLPCL